MISDLPHIDKCAKLLRKIDYFMHVQCVPGLSLGRGDGGGEWPGNKADTMEDCADSALCEYGFMLKSSDFHNGDPLSTFRKY